MKTLVLGLAALLVQLYFFLCAGLIINKMKKKQDQPLSEMLLTGFFAYFTVFEVICFLCEVTLAPLSRLTVIMVVIGAAVLLAGTALWLKERTLLSVYLKEKVRLHGFWLAALLLASLLICFFALIYTDASADSDFYVGTAATALFTNSIGRFEPTSGRAMTTMLPRYAYTLFPYHNAVMADVFRIPVIVQARSVMSVINALMGIISTYYLGTCLFRQRGETEIQDPQRQRKADIFTLLVLVLNAFSATIYMPGAFFFSRSFEGKHLAANVLIPFVMAALVKLYRDTETDRREALLILFPAMAAGVCFSASTVTAIMLLTAGALPLILFRKEWKMILYYLTAALPYLIWMVLYVLNSKGVFVLSAHR